MSMRRASVIALLTFLVVGSSTTATSAQQLRISPSQRISAIVGFRGGKTIQFSDGLVITLLAYRPVHGGLTSFPGGPPLRPRKGHEFVTTTWLVRNITHHTVTIETWVAKSRGMQSREFTTGNAGQAGNIGPGVTAQFYWFLEVAMVGRVAIFFGSFGSHWLPRE